MPSNSHDPFISTYLHKRTGLVTASPSVFTHTSSLKDEAAETALQRLAAPGIHCYRNNETGEASSVTTRLHPYGGGFAVHKRQRTSPGQESDGISLFHRTEITRITHGLKHIFQHNREHGCHTGAALRDAIPDDVMETDHHPVQDEENEAFDPTPTIARAGRQIYTRRSLQPKEKEVKLSDNEKLAEFINVQTQKLVTLSQESLHNPHIRVYHTFRKGRTFAYASAFLKSERGPKAIISVLWETRTSPHRAVTVTFSVPDSSEPLTAHCSCDYLITQTKGSIPNCYHAQTLFNNHDFVDRMKREISRRQEHPESSIERCLFGDEIDLGRVRDSSPFLTAILRRNDTVERNLKKPWLYFVVLDVRLQLFVPVMKTVQKSLECQGCRLSSVMEGNCCHVDACISACKSLERSGGWYRFLDQLGLIHNDNDAERDTDIEDEEYCSDDDQDNDGGTNRSVSVPEVYFPAGFRRPILPCPGELRMMKKLADMIDFLPAGETLTLDEKDIVACPKCNGRNTEELHPAYRREVTLFTLTQGAPTIHVYDWFCHTCQKRITFGGKHCAVFPAFRHSCYTTELMYLILEMTCLHALSFRTAYRITRLIGRSPSVARKLGKLAQQDLLDHSKRSRRRMNDAFGAFVEHLDTSSLSVSRKLFSCDNCEIPLSADDCAELGIEESFSNDHKRFRAVVIDGTAAGILTKLPQYDRNTMVVPAAVGGFSATNLIKPKTHSDALKKLFDLLRVSLKQWKRGRSVTPNHPNVLKFWIHNPKKATMRDVICAKRLLKEKDSQLTQLFINENSCFCPGDSIHRAITHQHWDECETIRNKFRQPLENVIARDLFHDIRTLLKRLFTVTQYIVPDPEAQLAEMVSEGNNNRDVDQNDETNEAEETEEEDEEPVPASHGTVCGAWVALNVPNEYNSPLFIDSAIALLRFLFFEHISFPYSGRLSQKRGNMQNASDEENNGISPSHGVADVSTSLPGGNREDSEQINSEFGTVQNDMRSSGADMEGMETSSGSENDLPPIVSFPKEAFRRHELLFTKIEQYLCCMHFRENGRVHSLPRECQCIKEVKSATVSINEMNPILGNFCQEFLKVTRPISDSHGIFLASLLKVLRHHVKEAKEFFISLANSLPDECEDYWHQYGKGVASHAERHVDASVQDRTQNNSSNQTAAPNHGIRSQIRDNVDIVTSGTVPLETHEAGEGMNANEDTLPSLGENDVAVKELEESKLTGICFPGRVSCRPSIMFKGRDRSDCAKQYKTSRSHTPGLLTVQCACDSPKLLGFTIMTQAESTALALSSVITHFPIPPRTVFYDNACNLYKSVLIRVPWLLEKTRLLVDRFHYKSHKCGAYFSPDSYRQYDNERTETAESINARIEKGLKTIRYMKAENLMPFLRVRFSLLNICACLKQQFTRTDIEDEDLTVFFNAILPCTCELCNEFEMDKIIAAGAEQPGSESENNGDENQSDAADEDDKDEGRDDVQNTDDGNREGEDNRQNQNVSRSEQ